MFILHVVLLVLAGITISDSEPDHVVKAKEAFRQGVEMMKLDRTTSAKEHFERACELLPDRPQLWAALANTQLLVSDLEGASTSYERALEIDPDHPAYLASAAKVTWQMDRFQESIALLERALEQDKKNPELYFNYGMSLRYSGRLLEAAKAFRKTVKLQPSHPTAWELLSNVLYLEGSLWEAVQAGNKHALLHPEQKVDDSAPAALKYWRAINCTSSQPSGVRRDAGECVQGSGIPSEVLTMATQSTSVPPATNWLYDIHVVSVLSPIECDNLISAAEDYGQTHGWRTQGHHANYPTYDIVVADVPFALRLFNEKLRTVLLPLVARYFRTLLSDIWVADAFIVKYDTDLQSELGTHTDGSILTFTINLSDPDDYDGGGTTIERLGETVVACKGCAIFHCGRLRHGGAAITRGKRYVLAAFVGLRAPWLNRTAVQ